MPQGTKNWKFGEATGVLPVGGCGGALPEGATAQAVAGIVRNGEGEERGRRMDRWFGRENIKVFFTIMSVRHLNTDGGSSILASTLICNTDMRDITIRELLYPYVVDTYSERQF
jgi:hypothetical protein